MINKPNITVEAKIYGMLLEFPETNFLSVQLAYSLEEAFALAKIEMEELEKQMFVKDGQRLNKGSAKINLFACKTFDELNGTTDMRSLLEAEKERMNFKSTVNTIKKTSPKVGVKKKEDPVQEKNLLMKKIIEEKDKKLFKKSLGLFTDAEIKYIDKLIK